MRSLGFAVAIAAVGIACSSSTTNITNVTVAGDAGEESDGAGTAVDASPTPDGGDPDAGNASDGGDGGICTGKPSSAPISDSCYVEAKCSACGSNGFTYLCSGAGRPKTEGCVEGGCCPAACVRWADADTKQCGSAGDAKFGYACPFDQDTVMASLPAGGGCSVVGASTDHPRTAVACCLVEK